MRARMGDALEDLAARIRGCTLCRLHEGRGHAVPGEGPADAKLFLVGEAPGRHEDAEGRPFVGAAGEVLDSVLGGGGLSRRDVFITDRVKCRPPQNRKPRPGRPVKAALSSGCAVVDPGGRILLIRRADERIWGLPKGTVEPGETLEETAVREVREETGLRVRILAPLTEIRYRFYSPRDGANVDKRVVYFLAERVGGRLKLEPGFDDARWFTKSDALRRLHFENDRTIVRRAFEALAGSTGRTRGRGPAARR